MTKQISEAVEYLKSFGLSQSAQNPMLVRGIRRLGLPVPPPIMMTFSGNFVFWFITSFIASNVALLVISALIHGESMTRILVSSAVIALLTSVSSAIRFDLLRTKHGVMLWRQFKKRAAADSHGP